MVRVLGVLLAVLAVTVVLLCPREGLAGQRHASIALVSTSAWLGDTYTQSDPFLGEADFKTMVPVETNAGCHAFDSLCDGSNNGFHCNTTNPACRCVDVSDCSIP